MPSGFELEAGIGAAAENLGNDFLESTQFARTLRNDLQTPALPLGEPRIHPEQVSGEESRLVAASTCPNLEKDVSLVVRVLREQFPLQPCLDLCQLLPRQPDLVLGERAHLGFLRHLLRRLEVHRRSAMGLEQFHHGADLGVFHGQPAVVLQIVRRLLVGQKTVDLLPPGR